jgi:hypothetical protein
MDVDEVLRFLARYVAEIAETWLDWRRLGPMVDAYVARVESEVAADTRKHFATEAFRAGIYGTPDGLPDARARGVASKARRQVITAGRARSARPTSSALCTGTTAPGSPASRDPCALRAAS